MTTIGPSIITSDVKQSCDQRTRWVQFQFLADEEVVEAGTKLEKWVELYEKDVSARCFLDLGHRTRISMYLYHDTEQSLDPALEAIRHHPSFPQFSWCFEPGTTPWNCEKTPWSAPQNSGSSINRATDLFFLQG